MIRVYVGCAANHEDAESQAVLEWSIRKHTTVPVEITWMHLSRDPASPFYCNPEKGEGWRTEKWATPFSAFRWCVPELAGHQGRAIYMDSDFIVLADLRELWEQPIPDGKVVLGRGDSWRLCCSLWDCERAKAHVPPIEQLQADPNSHRMLSQTFAPLTAAFEGMWNCLDGRAGEDLADVKALHLTDMRTQCQLPYAIPRLAREGRKHWFDGEVRPHPRADVQELFDSLLAEAWANGYQPSDYMTEPLFGEYRKRRFSAA